MPLFIPVELPLKLHPFYECIFTCWRSHISHWQLHSPTLLQPSGHRSQSDRAGIRRLLHRRALLPRRHWYARRLPVWHVSARHRKSCPDRLPRLPGRQVLWAGWLDKLYRYVVHRCQHYRFWAWTHVFLAPSHVPAFHLNCPTFLCISSWKKCTLYALSSVKWNSDDSATSFQCSANIIRSAKL